MSSLVALPQKNELFVLQQLVDTAENRNMVINRLAQTNVIVTNFVINRLAQTNVGVTNIVINRLAQTNVVVT